MQWVGTWLLKKRRFEDAETIGYRRFMHDYDRRLKVCLDESMTQRQRLATTESFGQGVTKRRWEYRDTSFHNRLPVEERVK